MTPEPNGSRRWLNSTVLGIGLASLLSDWSHEAATTVLPAFLGTMGVAAAWVGLIEGTADGFSSLAKLGSGHFTDRLAKRKPVAVIGYLVTALSTASFGLATAAWQVLISRSAAWLGRGVRTPIRKALLAASVTRETYGRAFGFERMMDTVGAIAGPATAFLLLKAYKGHYPPLFAWTLLPGLLAAVAIGILVKERSRGKVACVSFREGLKRLPPGFRGFLAAAGIFGAGDFAHTLLILLAVTTLTPILGPARAGAAAVALYVAHNVFYCGFALVAGWMADRLPKALVLAAGYLLAALMAVSIIVLSPGIWTLGFVFACGGMYVAIVEAAEDSFCAELVPGEQHGMAFGVVAAVNGVGDFVSSAVVGALWTFFGTAAAFSYTAGLSVAAAVLLLTASSSSRPRNPASCPS